MTGVIEALREALGNGWLVQTYNTPKIHSVNWVLQCPHGENWMQSVSKYAISMMHTEATVISLATVQALQTRGICFETHIGPRLLVDAQYVFAVLSTLKGFTVNVTSMTKTPFGCTAVFRGECPHGMPWSFSNPSTSPEITRGVIGAAWAYCNAICNVSKPLFWTTENGNLAPDPTVLPNSALYEFDSLPLSMSSQARIVLPPTMLPPSPIKSIHDLSFPDFDLGKKMGFSPVVGPSASVDDMMALFPDVYRKVEPEHFPDVCGHPIPVIGLTVKSWIIHLNDTHKCTREQISDWLDYLTEQGYDLIMKSDTKGN